jgi:cytosine/adenosine deaminase-related metal-dependent hydrolase
MATHRNRAVLRQGRDYDSLAPGKMADFVVFDGDPLASITELQDAARFVDIWMDGKRVVLPEMPAEMPRHPAEASQGMWNRVYTRQSIKNRPPADTRVPDSGPRG